MRKEERERERERASERARERERESWTLIRIHYSCIDYPRTRKISHTKIFIEGIPNHVRVKIERAHKPLEWGQKKREVYLKGR